ncbi:MAG: energy transducer TonB, partial [Woeseiaceae bacterium]
MIFGTEGHSAALKLALTFALLVAPVMTAHAQTYQISISNQSDVVVLDQAEPEYPSGEVSSGQEGWVRMHFVVAPDGSAVDPVIIDSSGGAGFEAAAIKATETWRFEAAESGAELPNNLVNIRTRIRRNSDGPSSEFIRDYRDIMRNVVAENVELARSKVDEAQARGGWNLYESTLLWLVVGRVESAEGDMADKLEAYRRALSMSSRRALGDKDRAGLMGRIFSLQDEYGQYAEAMRTYSRLENSDGSEDLAAELGARAAEIEALMTSAEPLIANATIYNPCNCDAGKPLWYYRPARRTFSFANLNGNVERFEARCDSHRISGDVEVDKSWTLAPEWGNCRVFVFGDDRATFDFVEHASDGDKQSDG